MSDDILGTCCALTLVACCDVVSGACLDFASIRHQCTQNLCSCGRNARIEDIESASDEREPLVSQRKQPSPHPPMRSTSH
ncbi:hypothetical protein BV22DRAFT_1010683 [Leucogyrophana mollusca]|uniref:Uncharacterized protein n=1 Tax=Leucogyrophana mollusca TaxID=85980 RepID=A0ACB8BLH6_9AGAM|nr:hypothetical protein BV22DRAFT_1010683 [Leucogyrophana mollusca]